MIRQTLKDLPSLFPRNTLGLKGKTFLFLLQGLVYAFATGTKGAAGNQWDQDQGFPQQRWPQSKGPLGGWDDEVSNPQARFPDQKSMWKLEDSVPGIPGQSYPNFRKIPDTTFDCRKQMGPGYYADLESKCQVFHICQADGRQNSFLCPIGTIFNQQSFTCDWWFNVICDEASMFYVRNGNLYKSPYIGIDGSKVSSYSGQRRSHKARSVQQSPVAIPNDDSHSKGVTWPPPQQNPSRASWSDNQKGDNRPMNQRNSDGRQSHLNKGFTNANVRQRSSERGQKGSRRGQNVDQRQQKGHQSQKGFRRQGIMDATNQGWTQSGDVHSRLPNTGIFNQQSDTKGENRRQFIGGHQSADHTGRSNARRMGSNRGINYNKGFDTNTWSIRAQNFQASSQDRKGSSSDVLQNNYLSDYGPGTENFSSHQGKWQDENENFKGTSNEEYSQNRNQNNDRNDETESIGQWDEYTVKENQQSQWANSYENDYDYS